MLLCLFRCRFVWINATNKQIRMLMLMEQCTKDRQATQLYSFFANKNIFPRHFPSFFFFIQEKKNSVPWHCYVVAILHIQLLSHLTNYIELYVLTLGMYVFMWDSVPVCVCVCLCVYFRWKRTCYINRTHHLRTIEMEKKNGKKWLWHCCCCCCETCFLSIDYAAANMYVAVYWMNTSERREKKNFTNLANIWISKPTPSFLFFSLQLPLSLSVSSS